MKLRNPWLIRLTGFLGAWLIKAWMSTIRYRYQLNGQCVYPDDPALPGRYIYVLWHEAMLFPAGRKWKARASVLISRHADGELIAQVCRHLRVNVVRGSSRRGGAEALRELLRRSQHSHLLVTPDGPRGPRRQVQPGVVYLASRTGLPIVPAGIAYQRAWRARSWDRFALPRPGSLATCVAGTPVCVPPDIDKEGVEYYRQLVEQELLKATATAEKWAGEAR